jgi:hypothetical protein
MVYQELQGRKAIVGHQVWQVYLVTLVFLDWTVAKVTWELKVTEVIPV